MVEPPPPPRLCMNGVLFLNGREEFHDTIHGLPAVLNYSVFEWISNITLIDLNSTMMMISI